MVRDQPALPVGVEDGAGGEEDVDVDSRGVGLVMIVEVGELVAGFVGNVGRTVRVGTEVVLGGEPVEPGAVVGATVVGGVVGLGDVVIVGAVVVGFDVRVGAVRELVGRREEVDPGAGRRKIDEGERVEDRTEDEETVMRSCGEPGSGGAVSSVVGVSAASGAPGDGVWCWVATSGASKTRPLVT